MCLVFCDIPSSNNEAKSLHRRVQVQCNSEMLEVGRSTAWMKKDCEHLNLEGVFSALYIISKSNSYAIPRMILLYKAHHIH